MKITRVDRSNDNTPILSNDEIDKYAYDVLKDFQPDLLHEPGTVLFENFVEDYLGLKLLFKDIYTEKDKSPILGRTIFYDTSVKVFDREDNRVMCMPVYGN
jgi:hypothetical protein